VLDSAIKSSHPISILSLRLPFRFEFVVLSVPALRFNVSESQLSFISLVLQSSAYSFALVVNSPFIRFCSSVSAAQLTPPDPPKPKTYLSLPTLRLSMVISPSTALDPAMVRAALRIRRQILFVPSVISSGMRCQRARIQITIHYVGRRYGLRGLMQREEGIIAWMWRL
jgi:hypothetical protein